jgi:hypothetical protein
MTSAVWGDQVTDRSFEPSIEASNSRAIETLLNSLPKPEYLSAEQRRGIIARYSAVLEGNFIYWMTAAYLSAKTEAARSIILENLHEEIRDCHPGMMRRFAIAAAAVPTDSDALAVYPELSSVRLFVGQLSAVPILTMMAFFEGLIQRFMAYLADLAKRQGSQEFEYTDVHGVCDVAHTAGLLRAVAVEMDLDPPRSERDLFEGVSLLTALIRTIVYPGAAKASSAKIGS